MRLLVTRPREDSAGLVAALADIGVEALSEPLLQIEFTDAPPPDLGGVQALLVTSANGVRAFARVSPERDIPVYAVGDASARAAGDLGFSRIESAAGDVGTLSALVGERLDPADGDLLHVAGSRLAGDLAGNLRKNGFEYRRAVLYGAEKATELSGEARAAFEAGTLDGVVMYSPRTADGLADLLLAAGLTEKCKQLTAFCLSAAVADKARALPWRDVVVAASPDQAALIETIGGYS